MKQSKKEIIFEIIRFLIVGGLATLADYAVFYLFNLLILKSIDQNANLIISTALGFITGFFVNWFLQTFVYKQASGMLKSKMVFLKYTIVSLIGLGLTELGMYLSSPLFDLLTLTIFGISFSFWKLFFKVLMTIIVLAWNYIARKLFVFVKKEKNEESTNNELVEEKEDINNVNE